MSTLSAAAPVVVIGSANQDLIVRVPAQLAPGETLLATAMSRQPGGKGANQAVAAARLGGRVSFVGAVGDDDDGASLIGALRADGVDTSGVEVVGGSPTGLAIVTVADSGENTIVVVSGANAAVTVRGVEQSVQRLAGSGGVAVIQAELTTEAIAGAVTASVGAGLRVLLNLAPYQELPRSLLAAADPLVLNETEASALLGRSVRDAESATAALEDLLHRSRSVIVTLGAAGAVWADDTGRGHVPSPVPPRVVDTTGAGDAFVGAVAVLLAEGGTLADAVAVGVRAGSFAVGAVGAQSSYATRRDLGLRERRDAEPEAFPAG